MSLAEQLAAADACHGKSDIHGNVKILQEVHAAAGGQIEGTDPELLWRLARSEYDLQNEATDKAEKEKHVDLGLSYAKAALDAAPDNFAAHKWFGILLGSKGNFISTKEKIANAYVIRDHFKKALELNPTDGTVMHCLGNWCHSILQIGWVERQAASLLFGTPPTSTYEECEGYLLKSAEISDQSFNSVMLGDVYAEQKKWADAKKWYQKAIDAPVVTESQKRTQEEAKAKLAKC
eukprot:PhM_4_TR3562/c1_g1_i1/m.9994